MNTKGSNQSRITIDISKDIHKQLKTIAAIKGKSMRKIVIESITKYLFSENIPNKETLKAIKNAEEGKDLFKAKNINDLFKKLGI